MVESKTFTTKLLRTVNYALLSILALSCLYPLWYTLCLSLSDKTAANSGMVTLWPINFTTISYREIMKESKFFHSFFISVQRTVLAQPSPHWCWCSLPIRLARRAGSFPA